MSNDKNMFERILKLWTKVMMMVIDGKRSANRIAVILQEVIDKVTLEDKFRLNESVDLGVIVVPEGFRHDQLDGVLSNNYPNPSRTLKPGDKFQVCIFEQTVDSTTAEERISFLVNRGATLLGAQGVQLVTDQKDDKLPTGFWYSSLDHPDQLWQTGNDYQIPDFYMDFGSMSLCASNFRCSFGPAYLLLGFFEVK